MLNVRLHGVDLPDVDMTFPCGSRRRSPIADAMVGSRPSVNPLPHPESLPLFALSQRRSAFDSPAHRSSGPVASRALAGAIGRLRLSTLFRARLAPSYTTKGLPIKRGGKTSRNAFKVMSMKAHWTIVYWCADHAHGSGFFGLLFTLEPTKKRSVRA